MRPEESKVQTGKHTSPTAKCWSEISPVVLNVAPLESPQKFSAVKTRLALRQETVEKGQDSILGESPSPSKQVDRFGWNLDSPDKFDESSPCKKFTLTLDRVPAPEEVVSDQEMSSHDLTAEEEIVDRRLKTFAGSSAQKSPGESDGVYERTCSEIRLSFFSPTKLQECYVNRPVKEAAERFHSAIEKHERDLTSERALSVRQEIEMRHKQRIQSAQAEGNTLDSPCTRDRKYKQMQNDIFNKIQAQLQAM